MSKRNWKKKNTYNPLMNLKHSNHKTNMRSRLS